MEEKEEKRSRGRRYPSVVWPVTMIVAGILILLSIMGYLEVSLWKLWRLWPLLLVLTGLDIIFGRHSRLGNFIVLVISILVVGGAALYIVTPEVRVPLGIYRIDEPLDDTDRADLEVEFSVGRLDIGKVTDPSALIRGELQLGTLREPLWEMERDGGQALMKLGYQRGDWQESWNWRVGDEWDLSVSAKPALSLKVNLGAASARIDLSGLALRALDVKMGVGQTIIILPGEGDILGTVSVGVGALVLEIPDGIAARIRMERGLSRLEISGRFEKQDELYLTEDWDTNEQRIDLSVEMGVGIVTVRDR